MIHHAHKCEMNIKINRDLKRSRTYQDTVKRNSNKLGEFFYLLYSLFILPG